MKIIGNTPFELVGGHREQITVQIQPSGTAHLVHCILDGQSIPLSQGQPLIFLLNNPVTLLQLSFAFTDPQSGNYLIRVFGSAGGHISEYILSPAPNVAPVLSLTYRFQLEVRSVTRGGPRFSGKPDLGGDETKEDY